MNVTAGLPSELGYTVNKISVPVGTVVFKLENAGTVAHDFKICKAAVTTSTANSCAGAGTRQIAPGATATLTVTFTKAGTYEYLCTIAGHAAGGMKGLLGVGVKVAPAVTSGTTTPTSTVPAVKTSTGQTPTTGSTTREALLGDPASGASVFKASGCAACHVLRAAGAAGQVGPSLDDARPAQDLVISKVTGGSGAMPGFSGQLTAQQIKDVAAYVYQSTH